MPGGLVPRSARAVVKNRAGQFKNCPPSPPVLSGIASVGREDSIRVTAKLRGIAAAKDRLQTPFRWTPFTRDLPMKKIVASCLLGLVCCGGLVGMRSLTAVATQAQPLTPAVTVPDGHLLANRLGGRVRFNVRASGYRRGGFARGSCPAITEFQPVVPMPENATQTEAMISLTASTHPTLFIRVPDLPATSGNLIVSRGDLAKPLGERFQQVYKVDFDLSGQGAGIVGIRLPEDAPDFQLANSESEVYSWQISINCDPNDPLNIVTVNPAGMLQRVPDLAGTPDEQLAYYLEEGIWQESLTILAADRVNSPLANATLQTEWEALMEGGNLSTLASSPVIEIVDGRLVDE